MGLVVTPLTLRQIDAHIHILSGHVHDWTAGRPTELNPLDCLWHIDELLDARLALTNAKEHQ